MTTYFLINRKNNKNIRGNYDYKPNSSKSLHPISGGVPTPLSLIASESRNPNQILTPKMKKGEIKNREVIDLNTSNSSALQSSSRHSLRNEVSSKSFEMIPSYNQPKPIITDFDKILKSNFKQKQSQDRIVEEEGKPGVSSISKGDAWEKLKELGSSVPPPSSDPDFTDNQYRRPVTITSPTGVKETNLDDISPPRGDKTNSLNIQNSSNIQNPLNIQNSNKVQAKDSFKFKQSASVSSFTSGKLPSFAETNKATIQSEESLLDIDNTQGTSIDESSLYHSSSISSASDHRKNIAEGFTRTDLETPSPAFNARNSGESSNLQWVYPTQMNPIQMNPPENNPKVIGLYENIFDNGQYGKINRPSNSRINSNVQSHESPQINYKRFSQKNFVPPTKGSTRGSLQGSNPRNFNSFKSDSSGTNSARRKQRNNRRESKSKDDDEFKIPLLGSGKQQSGRRSAASDTEEELELLGAFSSRRNNIGYSSNPKSNRKGSLPDYYKPGLRYDRILPQKLPSLESVSSKQNYSNDLLVSSEKSRGSMPMIPFQELKNVNKVLADFGVQMTPQEPFTSSNIQFRKLKNEKEKPIIFNKKHSLQDEHELFNKRMKNFTENSYKNSFNINIENHLMQLPSKPFIHRFPCENTKIESNSTKLESNSKNKGNCSSSSASRKTFQQMNLGKDSEYENIDSDVPYYEGDNEDNEELKNCDSVLVSEESEEPDVSDVEKSDVELDKLLETRSSDAQGLDEASVFNDTGLTDAEGALSDVNSMLNDPGHDGDMDDTSMSSRSGASSRLIDEQLLSIDSLNLMYDSEGDVLGRQNHFHREIISDEECFNAESTSDIEIDYFGEHHIANNSNLVAPNTLSERLENIRAITSHITRNFGQQNNYQKNKSETEDSEA